MMVSEAGDGVEPQAVEAEVDVSVEPISLLVVNINISVKKLQFIH